MPVLSRNGSIRGSLFVLSIMISQLYLLATDGVRKHSLKVYANLKLCWKEFAWKRVRTSFILPLSLLKANFPRFFLSVSSLLIVVIAASLRRIITLMPCPVAVTHLLKEDLRKIYPHL